MKDREALRRQKKEARDALIAQLHREMPKLAELDTESDRLVLAMMRHALHREARQKEDIEKRYQEILQEKEQLLGKVGLSLAVYAPQWDCTHCDDRGYTAPGKPCICWLNERADALYTVSGIPGKYRHMTFDTFSTAYYLDPADMTAKLDRCKTFAERVVQEVPSGNLVLNGDAGRGKTHLSVAIANHVLAAGKRVAYRRVDDLLDTIRHAKFDDDHDADFETLIEDLYGVDLLVLDDLGTEAISNFSLNQLLRLIEERNLRNRSWIINTNLTLSEIESHYDARLADRISEKASIFTLKTAESIRLVTRGESDVTMV